MKRIQTDIIIEAPVKVVWEVFTDKESYPTWNPFIKSIEGEMKEGEILKNTLMQANGRSIQFTPKVLVAKEEQEFRWLGHLWMKGIFDGEHYFKFKEISATQTRLTHGETFTGILAGLLMKMIGEDTEKGFVAMNEALKAQAEKYFQAA